MEQPKIETYQPEDNSIPNENWRDDISEPKETLKIADKETVNFIFQDEGKKISHPDYGSFIVFSVDIGTGVRNWYVNTRNFDLLGQIKALGKLKGLKCTVKRTGSKKSDTRYSISKVE